MIHIEGFPTASGPIDVRIARGEVVLLRGPNGSGKTSLLRAIAGLQGPVRPVRVNAPGACAWAPQDARDALVGLTVEGEFRLRRRGTPTAVHALRSRDSATLSSGEARRVGLATCDGADVDVLLLDEPAEGLDAAGRARLRALVVQASARSAVVAADHGGIFADLATRTLDLGPAGAPTAFRFPAAHGPTRLSSARATLARDAREFTLPSLALNAGFHVLTGPNGAGKSTLLLRLAGILDARGVAIDGAPPRPGVNVRLALPHARDAFSHESLDEEVRGCDPMIRARFVPDALLGRHPFALSGGEAQRANLVRTLGKSAAVYLLDEPEAHLDADGREALVETITRRVREGASVLAATHDDALQAAASRVILVGAA